MNIHMTIEDVVTASRNDVANHIASGTFRKESEVCGDNDENRFTIESLYSQWADNPTEAELAINKMLDEEFPLYV